MCKDKLPLLSWKACFDIPVKGGFTIDTTGKVPKVQHFKECLVDDAWAIETQ